MSFVRRAGLPAMAGVLVVLWSLAGCSSGTSSPKLLSLVIEPAGAKIVADETVKLQALGAFADGSSRDVSDEATWTSTDESAATVGTTGLVTGLAAPGNTLIGARVGDVVAEPVVIEVVLASERLLSIAIDPPQAELQIGISHAFAATGAFLDGSHRDLTEEAVWSTSDPAVVAVSNSPGSRGTATGLAPGNAEIRAALDGVDSTPAAVNVSSVSLVSLAVSPANPQMPIGTSLVFQATGTFSDQTTANLTRAVTWISSNALVAGFSSEPGEEGVCAALTEGSSTITAVLGGVASAPVTLQVTTAALQELQIEPMDVDLAIGTTRQFHATGLYSNGQVIDLTADAAWSSSATAVADFDAATAGRLRALSEGQAEVWASFGGLDSPRAVVAVTAAQLLSISLEPVQPLLPVGQTLQFSATGNYSDTTARDLTADVNWGSSDMSVASVSNATATPGLAMGLAEGQATISAALGAVSGSTLLTVQDLEIVSLTVTPDQVSLPVGESQQYVAWALYNNGSQAEVTSAVFWHVANALVAEIGNSAGDHGLATAVGLGSTTVWASAANGVAATPVELTVSSATLVSLAVEPGNTSAALGAQVQFHVNGTYSDSSQRDLTTSATWDSSEPAVAAISNAAGSRGLASALTVGVTQISASKDGIDSPPARFEVVAAALETIVLVPAEAALVVGETVQLAAAGHYSDGQDRDISAQVYWQSSAEGVAVVSNASGSKGLVTALAEGQADVSASLAGVDSGPTHVTVSAPVNQQPVAVLTGDATGLVGQAAGFSGAGSHDPDGTITHFLFDFGDGSPVVDNGTEPDITHVFAAPNTYSVTLVVRDDGGATGSAAWQITITDQPNEAPHAVLVCPGSGQVGQSLHFDGSNSYDTDGTIVSYVFNFGDGSGDLDNAGNPEAYHTYSGEGVFTGRLVVTDDDGAQHSAECPVAIGATTVPQVRIIRPQGDVEVTQGLALNVLVDATGQGGHAVTEVALLADGVEVGRDDMAPFEFPYSVPVDATTGSSIVLQARAWDDDTPAGMGQSDPVLLRVENHPPLADFTATISDTLTVTIDASACSDVETASADLEVRWDCDSDGTWDRSWSTQKIGTCVYPADGDYTITLEVRDTVAQTDSAQRTVSLASLQQVSGTVTSTTWYGTVVVTGSVTVPAGEVLQVNPNTQILVMFLDQNTDGVGDFGIDIQGEIHVNGTAAEPVLFSVFGDSHKEPGAWQGMEVSGSAASSIDWAVFEYADVGLTVRNASSVSNSVFRFNLTGGLWLVNADGASAANCSATANQGYGFRLSNTDGATLSDLTATGNQGAGLVAENSTGDSLAGCLVQGNGGDGFDLLQADLNISDCTVTDNGGFGLLYRGGSDGSLTHSQVTYNGDAGVRAESAGTGHPQPAINFNNIYGNSVSGGTITERLDTAATLNLTGYSSAGTFTSDVWSAPAGGVVRRAYVDFYENYYATGYLQKGDGTGLGSWSSSNQGWSETISQQPADLRVQLYNSYTSSSSASNRMTIPQVELDRGGVAGVELSVALYGGLFNARYNYWGAFPNVLDHIVFNDSGRVDIQGFVGEAFDASWDVGPYRAGEQGGMAWSDTIYVTGNTTVASEATLSVAAGTQVLFVPLDQDADGLGDYSLVVSGQLTVDGTAGSRVVFTSQQNPPAAAAYDRVRVDGDGSSTIRYADFRYALVGLELGDASLVEYTNITAAQQIGLLLNDADGCSVSHTAVRNNTDVGVQLQNTGPATLGTLEIRENGGVGLRATGSTGVSLVDSVVQDNLGDGLVLVGSSLAVDYCNILYNGGVGLRYESSAGGSLDHSNVKFNDLPGVLLLSGSASAHPSPVLANSNLFGNSVDHSIEASAQDTSAVLNLTGLSSAGTFTSGTWTAPATAWVRRVLVDFYENYYATGYLQHGDGSGIGSWSSSLQDWLWVHNQAVADLRVQLYNSYTSSSSASNRMTITTVEMLLDGSGLIEMALSTGAGTVSAQGNFWGQSSDVYERISSNRSGGVDYTGWELFEVAGCGPR